MPNKIQMPNQNPVPTAQNLQTPATEADLGRGAVQMGTGYANSDRVTGASGPVSMSPNPIGVAKKTLPGLERQ